MSIFGVGTDAVPISKFIYALRMWTGNQNIDFKEYTGGAEMSAAIDADHYLPDDLATAVASAMNEATSGASGASGDYDCSYDRGTDKFTITQSDPGIESSVLIDACSSVANWATANASTDAPTLCATAYTQGSSSCQGGKSGSAHNVAIYRGYQTPLNASGRDLLVDIFVEDTVELRAAPPAIAIVARSSSGAASGSSWTYNIANSSLATGFNTYGDTFPDDWALTAGGGGASAASAIDLIDLYFYTPSNNHTIPFGNIKWDNIRSTLIGDAAFELLWNTGASAGSGAASALGFSATADDTGASAYTADSQLPNRIVASQPIRKPRSEFDGMNRESISEAGLRSVQHRRTDIFFEFQMSHIPENELKDEWAPFMGKVDEVDGPWSRGLAFEWYPKATAAASGDYIVFHPDRGRWRPEQMLPKLPGFYRWRMEMREIIPKAGTLSLADIYTRTPG